MIEFIVKQIIHSGVSFLRRWYIERTIWFWSQISELVHFLDRHFAVFINLRLFFTPLYGDYSPMGRILGPMFRIWRVLAGTAVYGFICLIALAVWTGYSLFIPYLVFKIIV